MKPISFCMIGYNAWTPEVGFEKKVEPTPSLLRRRVTDMGQKALQCAWGLPRIEEARFVFSSRHGEFNRTRSILDAVAEQAEVSPADFTLSVHNALASLLSIALKNPRGHVAIGAGAESFCYGLLEAGACLRDNPDEPVVMIHFEEKLAEPFSRFDDPADPIALALALASTGEGERFSISATPARDQNRTYAGHAKDFLDFLKSGIASGSSGSSNHEWRWSRYARI